MSRPVQALRVALLGASTAALQTLLARELLSSFGGNEAVLASMLGPWFLLTALGAALGRRRAGNGATALALLGLGVASALSVLGARALPVLFEAGSAPGAAAALVWSSALLAPPCLLSGLAFAWLADAPEGSDRAGRAWLWESLGAAAAGAALSLWLVGAFPVTALLAAVVALSALAAALPAQPASSAGPTVPAALALGGGLASAALLLLPLEAWSTAAQLPGVNVRARLESPFGSIVVGEDAIYVDRRPALAASDPAGAEELGHLPLALHPAPRAVVVVGVVPAGTLRAMTAHGVERVEQLLDDPRLLEVVAARLGDEGAPVVRVAADARRWLAARPGAFDVVVLAAPEPTSAQLNRAFTAELFGAARAALREGGVFALALPGHAAQASVETRRLHSSVRHTLEAALGPARVLPLQRTLYVAGAAPGADVASTLAQRGVRPAWLTPALLQERLSGDRVADADRWSSLPERVNRDLFPTTYRLALDRALGELEDLGVSALAALAAALALATVLLVRPRQQPLQFAVATSGASGLATQLVLMLAYQVATGALYRELGLFLAGFMAGGAAGAALSLRARSPRRWVVAADLAQLGVVLALAAALPLADALGPGAARAGYFAAAALVGLLPGAQFAAAGRASALSAGALYGADLLGAALAALTTFTLVVPALGLPGTLVACAALKGTSALALLFPSRAAAPARRPLAPLFPLALVGFALLAVATTSGRALYALTFQPAYQWAALLVLVAAALAALEPAGWGRRVAALGRRLAGFRALAGLGPGRALHFALLLPIAAFPLARCYFKVPFVFCHVCPRQCVFGVLRPWMIPAAVLANLQGHRFCERLCPLGAAQGACEHVLGKRARRVAALWLPRALAFALVAFAWFAARAGRGEGLSGGPFYDAFFLNAYAPTQAVLAVALGLLVLALVVRRPFCEALCPVGAAAQLTDLVQRPRARVEEAPAPAKEAVASAGVGLDPGVGGLPLPGGHQSPPTSAAPGPVASRPIEPPASPAPELAPALPGAGLDPFLPGARASTRRLFLRRAVAGCGAAALSADAFRSLVLRQAEPGLAVGFRNDAPDALDRFSLPAAHAVATRGGLVQCNLCPHGCVLGENDRGFCRTRVVKGGQLYTVGYGNLCAAHLDPIEKKPLYHYLPRTPILSVAVGGCNLRCLNCQNWEISQARPEDVVEHDAPPAGLVATATGRRWPALAYTYSEPLMAFEYVRDTAALARAAGLKNVLVTAGYVNERPLRELCRVVDAVTLDVKAFNDAFYRRVSGGRLAPVLRTLEILREEKVWTEVSFLMVPTLSDSPREIADFARWTAEHLGAGTPFHILRFHPAHRLDHLGWTPINPMVEARQRALDAGLKFVYLGNVPGHGSNNTYCPKDGRLLIEREGYHVKRNDVVGGRCPCGEPIEGVFA